MSTGKMRRYYCPKCGKKVPIEWCPVHGMRKGEPWHFDLVSSEAGTKAHEKKGGK